MSLNILLLEDVHASATSILQTLRGAEIVRLKHAPDARELKALLADVQVLGLRSRTVLDIGVLDCSDWVFLLRQKPESIEMLDRKGRLSMDEPKKRLLNSLRTEPGVFSEVYISSPVGEGVARNILDPATHLLFSNKLEDNAPIDELRAQGMSIDEAIAELLRRRGHSA